MRIVQCEGSRAKRPDPVDSQRLLKSRDPPSGHHGAVNAATKRDRRQPSESEIQPPLPPLPLRPHVSMPARPFKRCTTPSAPRALPHARGARRRAKCRSLPPDVLRGQLVRRRPHVAGLQASMTLDTLSVPTGKVRRSVNRRKIVASFRSHSLRTGRSDGGVTILAMLS